MLLSWLLLFCSCLLLLFCASFLLPSPRFQLKSSLCAVLFFYRVSCSLTKYLVLLPSILFSYRISCSLTKYLVLLPSILSHVTFHAHLLCCHTCSTVASSSMRLHRSWYMFASSNWKLYFLLCLSTVQCCI